MSLLMFTPWTIPHQSGKILSLTKRYSYSLIILTKIRPLLPLTFDRNVFSEEGLNPSGKVISRYNRADKRRTSYPWRHKKRLIYEQLRKGLNRFSILTWQQLNLRSHGLKPPKDIFGLEFVARDSRMGLLCRVRPAEVRLHLIFTEVRMLSMPGRRLRRLLKKFWMDRYISVRAVLTLD